MLINKKAYADLYLCVTSANFTIMDCALSGTLQVLIANVKFQNRVDDVLEEKLVENIAPRPLGYQNPLYLSQARQKQPALYNGNAFIAKHYPVTVCDSKETLILAEESRLKMLEKQTVLGVIGYKGAFKADVIPFSENLKETFKLFEKGFIIEVKEMKDIFEQMEDEIDQCSVTKKSFEIGKKQLLINNDRLLEENIASDIMCTYLHSLNEVDNCGKFKSFDIVLLDLQESNKSLCELKKRFAKLEEYSITLDIAFQNHKEQMILNDPDTKNKQIQKIEDENVSLSFQVSSLVKEREHIKLEYKKLKLRAQLKGKSSESQMNHDGTSVNTKLSKPSTSGTKLYSVTPHPKSKVILKVVEKNDLSKSVTSHLTTKKIIEKCTKVIAPEARALKPLDEHIGHASKFVERIQELLVYVSASFLFTQSGNKKWASAISLKRNNKPYIDASRMKQTIETITKEHAEKQNTRKTDNTMLPSSGRIVEIVLWYVDSGCSKHMTGHCDKLINFVSKFIRTVRFDNNHFAAIKGYKDLQMGNTLISCVYYVEGIGHNLFSVGQYCDSNLEVAFRKHTCFVRNLEGIDLLSGSRGSNLYTISIADMMKSSPICLLSKASKTKSGLWHRRLSHLNFGTINKLSKQGIVKGLPKLKYTKDHLHSACQMGKRKKESYLHKPELSTNEKL
ncbi:retrovirus-related pol polyprotein from transposon TNT 1-94 [Tanacetum coccineum]